MQLGHACCAHNSLVYVRMVYPACEHGDSANRAPVLGVPRACWSYLGKACRDGLVYTRRLCRCVHFLVCRVQATVTNVAQDSVVEQNSVLQSSRADGHKHQYRCPLQSTLPAQTRIARSGSGILIQNPLCKERRAVTCQVHTCGTTPIARLRECNVTSLTSTPSTLTAPAATS